jgi:nucleoside-diphosphate-sugar epimerase
MKALVTGGTGFIGSVVVDRLVENGHSVRLFSRQPELPARLSGKDAALFSGDLEDVETVLAALAGMDVFYHIGEIRNTTPRAATKNVRLVGDILENIKKSSLRRIVFISSLTVAGIPSAIPATEETEPRIVPRDHYTAYKRECEEMLRQQTAVEQVILRPGVVYGPGSRYLGGLISSIERFGPIGFPFIGRGTNVAPLIFVNDLGDAIYRAGVMDKAAGSTLNLTDGLSHSWRDFFAAVARSLGKNFRLLPVPLGALVLPSMALDALGALAHMPFSARTYVEYAAADLLFLNTKARSKLDWSPRSSLEQGVESMVREYQEKRS